MRTLFIEMRERWRLALGFSTLGFVVSLLLITSGASVMGWTNSEEFCVGCHEMKNNVYAEYKGTIHDQNRTGVRATCVDCINPVRLAPW